MNSGVIKYLVALIWPIGLAIIAAAAFLGSRRYATSEVEVSSALADRAAATECRATGPASPTAWESARLGAFAVVGTVVVFGLMWALGQIVVYHGLAVDKPIFTWMIHHQVHALAALMNRLTKIGNTLDLLGRRLRRRRVPGRDLADQEVAAAERARRADRDRPLHHPGAAAHSHRLGPDQPARHAYPSGGCDRAGGGGGGDVLA